MELWSCGTVELWDCEIGTNLGVVVSFGGLHIIGWCVSLLRSQGSEVVVPHR